MDRPDPNLEHLGLTPLVVGWSSRPAMASYDTGHRTWPFFSLTFVVRGELLAMGEAHPPKAVRPGEVYVQFPGIRHRYMTKAQSANEQYWIHFRGAIPDLGRREGLWNPRNPILAPDRFPDGVALLRQNLERSAEDPETPRLLAVDLFHLLTLLHRGKLPQTTPDPSRQAFEAMVADMADHLGEPRYPWRKALAHLQLGEGHLRRLFHAWAGESPDRHFSNLKIAAAKTRLTRGTEPIQTIARDLGYHDLYHFSNRFKARVGMSPRDFRNAAQDESIP